MKPFFIPLQNLSIGLIVFGACFILNTGISRADTTDQQEAQVQTRGPVHEAFAGVIAFKPEAGVVVSKEPPDIIEEVAPDQKPEGENVTWIPGYWAWDDERNDFLWVSGVWRALPPGRQWVAGYWAKSGNGYQWTSGYWADASETKTTYLPTPPPATLENGPNIAAPSVDYVWIPGCWVWHQDRYAWRPGYWIAGRDDWDWSPDYYVWTPRGYVFVEGYWDYPVVRRGVLFAPVYFEPMVRVRPHYRYSPIIVIDLAVFPEHLFVRPRYHHYYFGDYYAASYVHSGFFVSFSFHSRGYGYDPFYAHERWEHRQDRDWDRHVESEYRNQREHENARPPRTWAAQKEAEKNVRGTEYKPVAKPFNPVSKETTPRHYQTVSKDEKHQFEQRGQEVRKSREERRTIESNPGSVPVVKSGTHSGPSTVDRPSSPIVSRHSNQQGGDPVPPSPRKIHEREGGKNGDGGGERPKRNRGEGNGGRERHQK